ncbi:MAG: hypothetical protein LUG99_23730, partial [Lachnospiraceae bacterium]|nr:hypothetical protein [Lachnospiraceae bacterium]
HRTKTGTDVRNAKHSAKAGTDVPDTKHSTKAGTNVQNARNKDLRKEKRSAACADRHKRR